MRFRLFGLFFLISILSLVKVLSVSAADLNLNQCLVYNREGILSDNNYRDCDDFLRNYVVPCLENGKGGDKLPASIWGPKPAGTTPACIDTDNNGSLNDNELRSCQSNFASFACANVDNKNGLPLAGDCKSVCQSPYYGYDDNGVPLPFIDKIARVYNTKYKAVNNITPTPYISPTAMPTPTGTARSWDYCKNEVQRETNCTSAIGKMASCIPNISEGDGLWSADFISVKTAVTNTFVNNPALGSDCVANGLFDGQVIRTLEQKYSIVQGNRAVTSITITPSPPPDTNPDYDPSAEDAPIVSTGLSASELEKLLKTDDETSCGIVGMRCCVRNNLFNPPIAGKGSINVPGDNQEKQWWSVILDPIVNFVNTIIKISTNDVNMFLPGTPGSNFYCKYGLRVYNSSNDTCMCNGTDIASLCNSIKSPEEKIKCVECSNHGIWTGLTCVDFSLQDFIQKTLFGWGLGLAGVSAFLCLIYASFQLQISATNPEKLKEAQELMTSCVVGLIVIIFSVFIIRFIGVDILRLPFLQ